MRQRIPLRVRARVAVCVSVAWILASTQIGVAAPVGCPTAGGASNCELIVGETRFVVAASDTGAGFFLIDAWEIGGVSQVAPGFSGFAFRDFSTPQTTPISSQLQAATVDVETSTIFVQFRELIEGIPGPFSLSVQFQVTHDGDTSVVTEVVTVHNEGSLTALSRIYDVMDFDLAGTRVDEVAFAIPSGPMLFQSDGSVGAEAAIISGPPADGYEVALCPPCDLVSLLGDATFDLLNIPNVPGPADFQSALSWDWKLAPGETLDVTLEKSITVPEPGAAATALAALLTLLFRHRISGQTRSVLYSPRKTSQPATESD